MIEWHNTTAKLGDLKPWAHNPRMSTKAQAKRLLKSWKDLGQFQTIAIGPDWEVYDGHQRLSALLTTEGPDYVVDVRQSVRPLSEEERQKLVITAHVGAVGSWDWDKLCGWDTGRLGEWGMDAEALKTWNTDAAALAQMLEAEQPAPVEDAEPQLDRAEELRVKWGVESGQLWQLGDHRLICGDCTDAAVVARVMGGNTPFLCVTDPPYGVNYDPAWRQEAAVAGYLARADRRVGEVPNDDRADWREAWELFPGDVIYSWHPGGATSMIHGAALQEAGFNIRMQIIWVKSNFPIGRGDYHVQHEPCWYAVRNGKPSRRTDDRKQTTRWDINLDKNVDGGHSTQKPLECMARPIRNHQCDSVYDPFVGSGTTIIACERLGRRCYAVEISPGYVAVALERWAQATGKTPVLLE